MNRLVLLFSLCLMGCTDDKSGDSDADFDADVPTDDTGSSASDDTGESLDTGEPPEEPQTTINVVWETEGVTITIENGPLPAYQFGLVDTLNEDGWRGEDCLNGMAGELHCHPLGETGGTLSTVFDIALIEPGTTTRHTHAEGIADALTYVLLDPDGNCLGTFGHLPDYYVSSALACPEAGSSK